MVICKKIKKLFMVLYYTQKIQIHKKHIFITISYTTNLLKKIKILFGM